MKTTITDRIRIRKIFHNLLSKPHKIVIKFFRQNFFTILTKVDDDFILLDEIEPFFINEHPEKLQKISAE
ncbi:MAG: hypothetical protein PHR06_11155, partial [Candidatus Cloacimonetes bacterium]|nr:hypothetical protein [Candidatus Cloacimonadota bacterium]